MEALIMYHQARAKEPAIVYKALVRKHLTPTFPSNKWIFKIYFLNERTQKTPSQPKNKRGELKSCPVRQKTWITKYDSPQFSNVHSSIPAPAEPLRRGSTLQITCIGRIHRIMPSLLLPSYSISLIVNNHLMHKDLSTVKSMKAKM